MTPPSVTPHQLVLLRGHPCLTAQVVHERWERKRSSTHLVLHTQLETTTSRQRHDDERFCFDGSSRSFRPDHSFPPTPPASTGRAVRMGSRVSIVEKRLDEARDALGSLGHLRAKVVAQASDIEDLTRRVAGLTALTGMEDRVKELLRASQVQTGCWFAARCLVQRRRRGRVCVQGPLSPHDPEKPHAGTGWTALGPSFPPEDTLAHPAKKRCSSQQPVDREHNYCDRWQTILLQIGSESRGNFVHLGQYDVFHITYRRLTIV